MTVALGIMPEFILNGEKSGNSLKKFNFIFI
jgi:hypothetical protein